MYNIFYFVISGFILAYLIDIFIPSSIKWIDTLSIEIKRWRLHFAVFKIKVIYILFWNKYIGLCRITHDVIYNDSISKFIRKYIFYLLAKNNWRILIGDKIIFCKPNIKTDLRIKFLNELNTLINQLSSKEIDKIYKNEYIFPRF